MNEAQRAIVGHIDGPLLVIAGPGSGKTYSIVLRALNLLLLEKAQPRQLVLSTFTEKAALEMRDRLAAAARKVGYSGDLSELTVSTIHSFCNRVLMQHRHRTELGHSYDTLDELTQLLFIFGCFRHPVLLRRQLHSPIVNKGQDRGVGEHRLDLLPCQQNDPRREDLPER